MTELPKWSNRAIAPKDAVLFAIEALNQESFDLVLMDVQMLETDGLEATAIGQAELPI